ncbi:MULTISPECIES: efflux RND transporter periplasmic adaptor subunit [Apibacter]|uniref:efflux RND transporter periplasmic adaptor subunit n=1 Tax=Apibacter TaxID=1778601 RepID=UPI001322DB17|nr:MULTISPECIES: efflux RND transporter periplasmic adaptor subunit [Apibacter]MCX8676505.1 efflux RND transporter periplasmic adaptor subunit [Apibacter sp. B3919]MXO23968.1 efflux RND transporter periplasmic adaptor subunit [Apibacter sp. B3924]MXO26355.1 efflux RND transporter periplasmic adaptor subunit [Apibacter sp. B3813]MXO28306.1 efflux RND transporter periplasmic adaptor subunit [Apibacter sp. B3913]MXO30260.1 efflux RND transporter periplasmic adaptor subunit [Apibacter sp. B3912]
MKLRKIQIIALLFTAATSTLYVSCGGDKKNAAGMAAMGGQANQVLPYPVKVVTSQTAVLETDYPATIKGEEDIEIRPMVEGFIKTINVDEGSVVKKGQVLFTLDAPQYKQNVLNAEAAIKTAKAQVDNAVMDVTKITPLVEKGIVSKYQLESAQYALQTKRAALNQAQTALAIANTNLSYTVLTSPVNGIVGSIPYRLGSLVNSTTTLTTVANTSNVYVYFSLNEKQLLDFLKNTPGATQAEKIKKSEPVTLILADGTEYNEKGKIETINGIVNTSTGSANFRSSFPNPQGILRSGSTGSIRISTTVENALVIPQKATFEIQGQTFVFVVQKDNKVKQVTIKVTPTPDGQSFIVNSGLNENDKIVVNGIQNLKEGMEIKPQL